MFHNPVKPHLFMTRELNGKKLDYWTEYVSFIPECLNIENEVWGDKRISMVGEVLIATEEPKEEPILMENEQKIENNEVKQENRIVGEVLITSEELFLIENEQKIENIELKQEICDEKPIVVREPTTRKITPNLENFEKFEIIKEDIFKKYRYRKFNLSRIRNWWWSNKQRPDILQWKKYFSYLQRNDIIGPVPETKLLKFNLKMKCGRYLTHHLIIQKIRKITVKILTKRFTVSAFRRALNCYRRPQPEDLEWYLDDLVTEGYLYKTKSFLHTYYHLEPPINEKIEEKVEL